MYITVIVSEIQLDKVKSLDVDPIPRTNEVNLLIVCNETMSM